jgi:hypothetical protein
VLISLRRQELLQIISVFLLFGGLAIIIGSTAVLANRWKRFGSSTLGRVVLGVSLIPVVLGLLAPTLATCYIPAFFHARAISMEKRLEILEDAVKRGEVSAEVAKTARSHIKKMFGRIEE